MWEALGLRALHRGTKARILVDVIVIVIVCYRLGGGQTKGYETRQQGQTN